MRMRTILILFGNLSINMSGFVIKLINYVIRISFFRRQRFCNGYKSESIDSRMLKLLKILEEDFFGNFSMVKIFQA